MFLAEIRFVVFSGKDRDFELKINVSYNMYYQYLKIHLFRYF
jgi:hypothetical protein